MEQTNKKTVQDILTNQHQDIKKEKMKDIYKGAGVIIALFLASMVAIFGIFNTFTIDLIEAISRLESTGEKVANYALLVIFIVTMTFLSTVYWKKKDTLSKISTILSLFGVLVAMAIILIFFINNIMYPLLTILVLGITFFLFNMLFDTLGLKGIFFYLVIAIILIIFGFKGMDKSQISTLFTVSQFAMALLLFIGTTYPRIRQLMFKIGTRNNTDIDGSVQTNNNDDDDNDEVE